VSTLIRAELLKVRSTRAAWGLLAATVGVTALAVAGAVVGGSGSGTDMTSDDGVRLALHVSGAGAFFVLVLGLVMTAGEHRHGTATDTYLTTPARWPVTLAKVATASVLGLGFGALSAGVSLAVASHAYQLEGLDLPTGSDQVPAILTGAVAYAVLFGAVGAAVGSLVRNQVGAIVGALAWLLVAEQIVVGLAPGVGRFLPAAAGRALVRDPSDALLGQATGALVLAGYAAAIVLLAVVADRRRDA
jgi:ABC-2 type transport system permease protein